MRTHSLASFKCRDFRFDFLAACFLTGDYKITPQLWFVVVKICKGDAALPEEAMALGAVPCFDTCEGKRDHAAVEQRDNPANRADKARALRTGPVHGTRPGDFLNHLGQDIRENLARGFSLDHLTGSQVFAF